MNITQETFDSYVKENIDELEMDVDEAVEDAIETSKMQGGNLFFIIKKHVEPDGRHKILHLLEKLLETPDTGTLEAFCAEAETFECRHWACMAGVAFSKFNDKIELALENGNLTEAKVYLRALGCTLLGQPDWTNINIVLTAKKALGYWIANKSDYELLDVIAKLVLAYSKMHEENRTDSMAEGIPMILCKVFQQPVSLTQAHYINAIRSSCAAIQAQMVDDDDRKAGSDAHGRAKAFVTEGGLIENCITLMNRALAQSDTDQSELINELMSMVTESLVCAEFCKKAADLGGGVLAIDFLRTNIDKSTSVKFCLNLIKNMIGNDDVRHQLIVKHNIHEDVIISLARHFGKINTALAALRCITALTLRNPDCARDLVTNHFAAETIANALNAHAKNKSLSRAALMAVRNCVARAPELREKFLLIQMEEIANEALKLHNLDEAKACLRDLGCEVNLKEIWTGSGHKLKYADTTVLKDMNIT